MRHLLLPFLLLLASASQAALPPHVARRAVAPAADSTRRAKPGKLRHADRHRQGPEVYLGSLQKDMQLVQDEPTPDTAQPQGRASARAPHRAPRRRIR